MNSKKRLALIAVIAVLVISLAFTLVACNGSLEEQLRDLQNKVNGYETDFSEKSVVVYVGEDRLEITTRKPFLHDVLKELKVTSKISVYEYSGGEVSPFITQVGDLHQDLASNKYYSVWHTLSESGLKSVFSEYAPSRGEQKDEWGTQYVVTTYNEILLYYSSVGVGYIPVIDGATYAILID